MVLRSGSELGEWCWSMFKNVSRREFPQVLGRAGHADWLPAQVFSV